MRLKTADGRTLWLGYGMNVHPGGTAAATLDAIESTVVPLRERLGVQGTFGLAVRWNADAVRELRDDVEQLAALQAALEAHDLLVFSGNAFVLDEFHGTPLKDRVYEPSWAHKRRVKYTLGFAALLAALSGTERMVSLSTAPGSWRGWSEHPSETQAALRNIRVCAEGLRELHEETGTHVVLGLEPEPRCTIETTAELRAFFAGPFAQAVEDDEELTAYIGVCFDTCHQAVMHEDCAASIAAIADDEIPIAKLQASCALELGDPAAAGASEALAGFDEPVYLHQVGAPDADGQRVHVANDLPEVLGDRSGRWKQCKPWRVHYHVPVYCREAASPLRTTQPELERTLREIARSPLTTHVEIETYTWDVLPESERAGLTLVDALAKEYAYVLDVLRDEGVEPEGA